MSSSAEPRSHCRWSPGLFIAAGLLMLVQVVLIGLRTYGVGSFPEAWIASFAICAVVAALAALTGLSPGLSHAAPRLAKAGAAAALFAIVLLCTAAAWLVVGAHLGGHAGPVPAWFPGFAAIFMFAFVLAFLLAAAASLKAGSRAMGCLLLVPAVAWSVIVLAGAVMGIGSALRLDLYTNGAIACALLALGYVAGNRSGRTHGVYDSGRGGGAG